MRNFTFLLVLFLVLTSIACTPPVTAQARPEYVGTWKGTNIGGLDIVLIVDETTYEFDLYSTGTTTLLTDSQRGTHGTPTPATNCQFDQTQRWDGGSWVDYSAERTVYYSINGSTMDFLYDETFPYVDPWVIGGQLTRQ